MQYTVYYSIMCMTYKELFYVIVEAEKSKLCSQ